MSKEKLSIEGEVRILLEKYGNRVARAEASGNPKIGSYGEELSQSEALSAILKLINSDEVKYKANFLWGKEGKLETLMYEFANAKSEEYREEVYKQIKKLTNLRPLSEKEAEKFIQDWVDDDQLVVAHKDWIAKELSHAICSHFSKPIKEPNMELEFRHTKTGCGGRIKMNMTLNELKDLKDLLSLPGLDMEITAVEYPHITIKQ